MLVCIIGEFTFKSDVIMFTNFFKVALRIFIRDRVTTLINIFGLAIGLTFSIIIFLYAYQEIGYDRFHTHAQRIYRVGITGQVADNSFNHAVTPAPLAKTLVNEIPEIESSVRVARFGAWLVRYEDVKYNEDNIIFTDPSFFRIFSFPLIQGDPEKVLAQPKSIVISQTTAERYFGQDNPVGKMLRIENDTTYYRVTGVMKDVPRNSHMHFDMVSTLSTFDRLLGDDRWITNYMYTYFLARENADMQLINTGLERIVAEHVLPDYYKLLNVRSEEEIPKDNHYSFLIQPLTSIHLKSNLNAEFEPVGKILYVYIFTALAVIILIFSCLNFVNLAMAQSVNRAKEVGIRKIAGSGQNTLIRQFLVESSLLAVFAMAIALFFTEMTLPVFSKYFGLHLTLGQLLNTAGIVMLVALVLFIGIISGIYPALYLASFSPVTVMRNNRHSSGRSYFRSSFVLLQLFIAIGAITMTLFIFSQYHFLLNKERGFDTENLLIIRRPDGLGSKLEDYKKLIRQHEGVLSVTNSTGVPGTSFNRNPFYLDGNPATDNIAAANLLVSYSFDSTYQLQLAEGRFFDRNYPDDSAACVINEAAAKQLGLEHPSGNKIFQITDKPDYHPGYKIIGVVRDFHFETLDNPVRPLVMVLMPGNMEGYLTVRLDPEKQESALQFIKGTWESYTAAYPFVSYPLKDEMLRYYLPVKTTGRVFTILSIIAVLIASLGLFSMVSYSYGRRQRIIGMQKALGATSMEIILHKISEIIRLVLIASVIAWGVSFFLLDSWLNDYAYHVSLNVLYFIAATVIVSIMSLLTIYYHASMAAAINPGTALRND